MDLEELMPSACREPHLTGFLATWFAGGFGYCEVLVEDQKAGWTRVFLLLFALNEASSTSCFCSLVYSFSFSSYRSIPSSVFPATVEWSLPYF